MPAVNLSESNAFTEGSSLWIIRNDPSLIWWKKIDLSSKYLLSQNSLKSKKTVMPGLENLISMTNLKLSENNYPKNYLLLGTEDHFLNKWVLLWDELTASELNRLIEKIAAQLKITSIRFFSDSNLIPKLEASPWAGSINISYIENC
ncbi:MAG: hypothetical protein AABY53_04955 [Bdellovibrionota bacterium]